MKLDVKYWKMLFVVIIAILFYCVIHNLSSVLEVLGDFLWLFLPFYIGGAIAFILNAPISFFEKKVLGRLKWKQTLKRVIAFIITLVSGVCIIYIVQEIVVPELEDTIAYLIEIQYPKWLLVMQGWLVQAEVYLPLLPLETLNWDSLVQEAISIAQDTVSGMLTHTVGIVGSIISGVTAAFVGIIFAVYILFQKERLARNFKKLFYSIFPTKGVDRMLEILRLANDTFSNFLSGQCMEAVILGTMFLISMSIFQLPYALLTGVVIAITALIPIFGAFIGLAIGAFLIVMVNPWQALGFIILFLVLQQIEGNFIYPYVVGNTVGLPAVWVLVAVSLGGTMLGVLGMILYIPLFSVAYALIRQGANARLLKKGIPPEKYEFDYDYVPPIEVVEEEHTEE
ncbi:MAG: AI-2E family transporter [Eubacteriales bacterium]